MAISLAAAILEAMVCPWHSGLSNLWSSESCSIATFPRQGSRGKNESRSLEDNPSRSGSTRNANRETAYSFSKNSHAEHEM